MTVTSTTSIATTSSTTTEQRRRYRRRLSQIERGYLNSAARGCTAMIQLVVDGVGRISADELRCAVAMATAVNPGLAVRRRGASWIADGPVPPVFEPPVFEPPVTEQPVTEQPVIDQHGAGPRPAAEHAGHDRFFDAEFFHRSLDVVRGPIAEVGLFRLTDGGSDRHRIVVRASHIAVDGHGLEHWLADVFRALRGEVPLGSESTVDDEHFVAAAGLGSAPLITHQVTRQPSILADDQPGDRQGLPETVWVRRRITAPPNAITARIAAVIASRLRGETGRILVPVDLRRHDRTVLSTANLSAPLILDVERDQSWTTLHRKLLGSLLRKQEVAALTTDFRTANPMAHTLEDLRTDHGTSYPCSAIISDHGGLDLADFSGAGFRASTVFTLPMVVPDADLFASCCPSGDGAELCIGVRPDPIAIRRATELLDAIAQALQPEPEGQ